MTLHVNTSAALFSDFFRVGKSLTKAAARILDMVFAAALGTRCGGA